jgi:hypothetical protein
MHAISLASKIPVQTHTTRYDLRDVNQALKDLAPGGSPALRT